MRLLIHKIETVQVSVTTTGSISLTLTLGQEAQSLLQEATKDARAEIMRTESRDGLSIFTNGQEMVERKIPQSEAIWENALQQLIDEKLITAKGSKNEIFRVSHKGFEYSKSFS